LLCLRPFASSRFSLRRYRRNVDFDPADVAPKDFYQHLVNAVVPRPIGWISTTSVAGVDNVAPYSFFNAVCAKPPTVFFSGSRDRRGKQKHSVTHALSAGEFVVNIVPHRLAAAMNHSAGSHDEAESEFDAAGLERAASVRVKPPRVAAADVHLECRVSHHLDLGDGGPMSVTLVFGEVVLMHIADRVLDDQGQIDAEMLDAIGRLGGADYCTTRDRFDLTRP
jgi:flavin reductase (DIM6/NTAB) family NADH-FMN oxidoreductase RutF